MTTNSPCSGAATLLRSPTRALDAIGSSPHGAIALTFVEWAGEPEQITVIYRSVVGAG
jgi:hypothetical protein